MAAHRPILNGTDWRDLAFAVVVLLGLALPFIPVPGDRMTRIAVRFQTTGMNAPGNFTTRTTRSICSILSAVMSYEDREAGEYLKVDCGRRAPPDGAARGNDIGTAKLVGATGIEPVTPTMSR